MIGTTLGQYKITAMLGQGGMATVYRATQASMGRDVAIKIMSAELSDDDEFISRFEREAQVFAILQHPHILPVIDFGKDAEHVYIVMRLVEGGSLDSRIRNQPMPLRTAVKMVEQIGSALSFAHNKGIVHRDLKPSNVLLDENDNTYLTDFGLAKMMRGTTRLTRTDAIMGTPTYMAPEQWRGEGIDARTDIYALGVMLYEMVTGVLPFEGDTSYVLMYKHMNDAPIAPGDHIESLSRHVEDVILQSLAKDPDDRFQTADDMARAFREAVEGRRPATMKRTILPEEPPTRKSLSRQQGEAETEVITQDLGLLEGTPLDPNDPAAQQATRLGTGDPTKAGQRPITDKTVQLEKGAAEGTPARSLPWPLIGGLVAVVAAVIAGMIFLPGVIDGGMGGSAAAIDLAAIPEQIAFNRRLEESQDIYIMNADGTEQQFINTGGKPTWTPDGQSIAFDTNFTGEPEIFLVDVSGFNQRNVTNSPDGWDFYAAYTPDGTRMAFHSNRIEGQFDIFVANVDGADPVRLTDNPANDQWPAYSPDGTQIAFSSQRDGNYDLYLMDADGENLLRLTEHPAADQMPAWSPDGTQIAFMSARGEGGRFNLYVLDVASGDITALTDSTDADNRWPSWSNSGYILFSSNRDGNENLYVIRPDGSDLTQITDTPFDERYAMWSAE